MSLINVGCHCSSILWHDAVVGSHLYLRDRVMISREP